MISKIMFTYFTFMNTGYWTECLSLLFLKKSIEDSKRGGVYSKDTNLEGTGSF